MTTKRPMTMTEAEFLASLGNGEPQEVLKARHSQDAALAEAHKNEPLTNALRIRITPGRPPKGEEAPVQVKAVKMPAAFWDSFQSQAQAAGLTLHAAMRNALLEWAGKHKAG
jgi:hypothetical protein